MKRRIVYGLLALPFIVFLLYFAAIPRVTREAFVLEFKHRVATSLGFAQEEDGDGPQGLRIERPEEYGLAVDPPTEDPARGPEDPQP